jgi:ATP-dependent protease ClpP protease subunit
VNVDRLIELANRCRTLQARPEAHGGDWYRVTAAQRDRTRVDIYGPIGDSFGDGVTAASFVKDLADITTAAIDLHINSPGGYVFDGVAIFTALRDHEATVDVSVDGVAASAASFVAMAGDTVVMSKPAKLFIHDAQGLAVGNAETMREMADVLDDLSDTIAGIYADRAGGDVGSWRAAMRTETWYSASQAVDVGLADRVSGDTAPVDNRSTLIRARARALTLT